MAEKKWIPLESNPDVLNEYAGKLGVDLDASGLRFCDVWSLDEVGSPLAAEASSRLLSAEWMVVREGQSCCSAQPVGLRDAF